MTFTTIAIMAESNHGKDFVGQWISKNMGFLDLAFADHIKRLCALVFRPFTDEMLWGDAKLRNQEVPINWEEAQHRCKYGLDDWLMAMKHLSVEERANYKPMVIAWFFEVALRSRQAEVKGSLSPRVALQLLGTEYGRAFKKTIWSHMIMQYVVPEIQGGARYKRQLGLLPQTEVSSLKGVTVTDCRFLNEMEAIQENGGYVLKVIRNSLAGKETPEFGIKGHASEAELKDIPEDKFDLVLRLDDGADNVYPRLQKMFDEREFEKRHGSSTDPYNNPPNSLRIIIPFLPPTSNHIYVTNWFQKKVFKSKDANAFQTKFLSEVVPKYLPWISQMPVEPSSVFDVLTVFYLDQWDVMNKGWFKSPRAAASRYKKMDTGNRLKLLHDCLSDAFGVDDSHFFDVRASKRVAQEFQLEPQVHVFVTRIQPPCDPGGTQCQLPMMGNT